ncbi:MAG: aldo/keto reductase, partial [Planctomycetia bacterium]|nr:aldo/keto reductase [Planctomycetia bacterium]
TSAQIALAWMMAKYPFIVPLFGTTKLSHLEEDIRTVEFPFTPADVAELEEKLAPYPPVGTRYDAFQQARVEY